jgi:hypothetical protein
VIKLPVLTLEMGGTRETHGALGSPGDAMSSVSTQDGDRDNSLTRN